MLRFKSIISRIIFLHLVAVIATATLLPIALYWFLDSDVEKLQKQAMAEHAASIARHLTLQPDRRWSLDLPSGLRDQYSEAYGRYSYIVIGAGQQILFASRQGQGAIFPLQQKPNITFFDGPTRLGQQTISGASLRKDVDGQTVWLQVAENLSHRDVVIDDIVANFFSQVGWITMPFLLVLLAVDILIFKRAIRPLLHASDRATQISPTRIDVRLPANDIPKEIQPLVVAVNHALDRLEAGFRTQREFTADVAHELRTPLTILRARMDTFADKTSAHDLIRTIESMSRSVGQLLDAAEMDALTVEISEIADLQEISSEIAGFLAPLALAQGKHVELSGCGGPVLIRGNGEMIGRAVRNLLENALKHTREGSIVEIVVSGQGELRILDRGPGIPVIQQDLIFTRFWRGDADQTEGAGLGLSIVKRIMEAHGGTIRVENRPSGGAAFLLWFPLASSSA